MLIYLVLAVCVIKVSLDLLSSYNNSIPLQYYSDEDLGPYSRRFLSKVANLNELESTEFIRKFAAIRSVDMLFNNEVDHLRLSNVTSDPLEIIAAKYPVAKQFMELPLEERAEVYVKEVIPESGYHFEPIDQKFFTGRYEPTRWMRRRMRRWSRLRSAFTIKELTKLGLTTEKVRESFDKIRKKQIAENRSLALHIRHIMGHMKIFGQLFLQDQDPLSDKAASLCNSATKTLFPWLSGKYPIEPDQEDRSSCFLRDIQLNSRGRGVVITADDSLVPELAGLLTILREQSKTVYPIQVFYMGDTLSSLSMSDLERAAGETDIWSASPHGSEQSLNVTFVNITEAIEPEYRDYFERFGMKLLSYLFNSFEEIILMDTDAVPFVPLDDFFELPQYRETSTLFYRDRESSRKMSEDAADMFRGLLNGEMEVSYLGKTGGDKGKASDRFFKDHFRHLMESGLFAINRKLRFDGVVASTVMQFFRPFKDCIHGEKEYIWLGQEVMGHDYRFNEHFAIAVGELTVSKGKQINELCSTHPAHIKDDKSSIMWMNSGFLVCKKPEAYLKDDDDISRSILEIKEEYASPLIIKHGLVDNKGWIMTSKCENYMWCASDGEVINFKAEDRDEWKYLGKLWVEKYHTVKERQKTLGMDQY
ncbi:DEKNAAC101619 [Brettanomyces naardenensis]|uniref:DEKNAAC101619 n=1 Tax=Brettanomyces naardenensis TaxID=13370 RepID=A0A448YIH2_BRENA|nr:DEKNAAC101619 [Brettanomyces naardenensis]